MISRNIIAFSFRGKKNGFTIVELLITIAVIGILSAITAVGYNGMQDKARATAIVENFKMVEDAFNLMAANERVTSWWLDEIWWVDEGGGYTGPHNPQIKDVMIRSNLKNYLKSGPAVSGLGNSLWRYDNDAVVYDPAECLASSDGVNIMITNVSQNIALNVDKIADDGNLACGKIRLDTTTSPNRLLYLLSADPNI